MNKIEKCSFNILVPTIVNISKLTSIIICNGFNVYTETRQFYTEKELNKAEAVLSNFAIMLLSYSYSDHRHNANSQNSIIEYCVPVSF
jgi:hypothetical protein